MQEIRSLLCPCCGGKTRLKLRHDTRLENFLLFCPKCKSEMLVNIANYHTHVLENTSKS